MTDRRMALICVDLQKDFLRPEGKLPVDVSQAQPMLETIHDAVGAARRLDVPVAHIVNAFPSGSIGNLFRKFAAIKGSPGAALDPNAPSPREEEPVFAKRAASGLTNPELGEWLAERGIEEIVFCGVYAGACVRATALAAAKAGYRATVLADGVADRSDSARARALTRMSRRGVRVVRGAELFGDALRVAA